MTTVSKWNLFMAGVNVAICCVSLLIVAVAEIRRRKVAPKPKIHVGDRFGALEVVSLPKRGPKTSSRALVLCHLCGSVTSKDRSNVRKGKRSTCGRDECKRKWRSSQMKEVKVEIIHDSGNSVDGEFSPK